MTSRERIVAAFEHKEPDRTPVFEYVLLPPVAEQILDRPFVEYLGGMEPWLNQAEEMGFERALRHPQGGGGAAYPGGAASRGRQPGYCRHHARDLAPRAQSTPRSPEQIAATPSSNSRGVTF